VRDADRGHLMSVRKPAAEISRARELDAQGRHDEAINELATAAQRGDVEATTALAKRIIVGDRAPRLGMRGVGLLQDAVRLGGAEAADRLAVILAAGVAGPPDWGSALRLLVLAAERGWKPAREQLEILAAASRSCAGATQSDPSGSPSAFSAEIDLRRLLVPAPGEVICSDPQIRMFPGFVDAAICDWLVNRARGRLSRALVYDVTTQTDFAGDSRTNSFAVFSLMDADLVHLVVQTRMSAACGQPVTHMEAATVLHYALGEQIGNHYDFVDPEQPNYEQDIRRFGHRIITFLVYLNSDYDGGETVFPKLGLRHRGQRGEGMFFSNTLGDGRADVRTLHSGQAPTRGEKWVFSQFIRNRPETIA
jgi:prolyl 4-hydroxylase